MRSNNTRLCEDWNSGKYKRISKIVLVKSIQTSQLNRTREATASHNHTTNSLQIEKRFFLKFSSEMKVLLTLLSSIKY